MPLSLTPEQRSERARRAAHAKWQRDRQRRHEQSIADSVQRIVDAAPELTPEQRDKLAVILRGAA